MALPQCFYQKAFWVVIPIMIAVAISVISYGFGMIEENRALAIENKIELAERDHNVNTLVPKMDTKLDIVYENQILMCNHMGLSCK